MNNLDKQYQSLLQDILDNGHRKGDRTGTGTISVFGRQIRHNMKDGFPLITTKKMYTKGIITELLWFLRGETNIKSLVENDCNIWNGDAYKAYTKYPLATIQDHHTNILYQNKGWCKRTGRSIVSPHPTRHLTQEEFVDKIKTDVEFSKRFGELGPVYGKQWRNWEGIDKESFLNTDNLEDPLLRGLGLFYSTKSIDQIQNAINDLKNNPDSRRIIVSAWKSDEIDQMTLPPCHNFFQFYTRELSSEERVQYLFYKTDLSMIYLIQPTEEQLNKENIPTRAISLMWNQRSVDTFLGLPFNIASYGLLLEIVGKMVNMIPEELIGNLGDTHLYSNHIEQAKEQIGRELTKEERKKLYENEFTPGMEVKDDEWLESKLATRNIPKRSREPYPLPKLGFNKSSSFFKELGDDLTLLGHLETSDFMVENYQSHPTIKAPLSN